MIHRTPLTSARLGEQPEGAVPRLWYSYLVLRSALEERLAAAGWMFQRETTYHRVWGKGNVRIPVPKLDILDEEVAKTILGHAGIDEW